MERPFKLKGWYFLISLFLVLWALITPTKLFALQGASLYLSPASGTFTVGSTFTVSVILDTNGHSINALEASLAFPADKLQVVSPTLGSSVISVWTNQPKFDNQNGTLSFQGGIPDPGIKTSSGVVATVTFRVKSVGQALVRFLDRSKVLLNDGLGTDVLTNTGNGIYDLSLPPPRGPIVVSQTNPDQARWYPSRTVVLRWTNSNSVDGYSYVLNQEPIDIPDDISEGEKNNVVYKNLPDSLRFFHVKALQGGVWGDTTHFAVKIDSLPPADFPIEISPSSRTSNRHPLINFLTTDNLSGIDHYELKIIPLYIQEIPAQVTGQPFFIEAGSPYSTELKLGRYQVIVRAYDKAGNFREVSKKLSIVTPILEILGFQFLPHWLVVVLGIIILIISIYFGIKIWRWHNYVHIRRIAGALNDPTIVEKLKRLREKQSRYFKNLIIFLACLATIAVGFSAGKTQASEVAAPPIVTTISKNISNEEIFYIGGKSLIIGSEVIVYIQNLYDGQAFSEVVGVDKKGDWFYSYPKLLSAGKYLVWTQSRIGSEFSAPSAQSEINVTQTAIQLGSSRLSFETLYLVFMILFLITLSMVGVFIAYHGYHGRKKHKSLMKEILEAEESIKRGFLILRRDLQSELAVLNQAKIKNRLSPEEIEKEKQLVKDLEWVNQLIEKEVRDIERLMGGAV